jgi:putative membrane protein
MTSTPDQDAERRTRLANERTYLAWWRTALTAFAVSVGTGKLVPALTDEAALPYTLLGTGFAVLGLGLVLGAFLRQRAVERAVQEGEFAQLGDTWLIVLSLAGLVLGVGVIAVTLA